MRALKISALCAALLIAGCGGGGNGAPSLAFAPTAGDQDAGKGVVAIPPENAPKAAKPDCSLLLLGDSVLNGGGMLEPPAATIKAARPAYDIADATQIGASASSKLPAILQAVITQRFVVVQYGLNDSGNGTPYEAPMRSIIDHIKAKGHTPILTGISQVQAGAQPLANWSTNNETARKLAADYGIPFADWGAVDLGNHYTNAIHPDQAGSRILSARLGEVLDAIAPECKP